MTGKVWYKIAHPFHHANPSELTHWDQVMHIWSVKWAIIGLLPAQRQAII